ncbi:MAG TPA: hypothetical protein VHO50_02810 [Bacteroidales bacterium]|nr:hypothetical protein [Bacteroidales bacterium]
MERKVMILLALLFLCSCERTADSNDVFLKFFGDAFEDIGYCVAQTTDGYIVAGQFTKIDSEMDYIKGSSKQFGVFKSSLDGKFEWDSYEGDTIEGIASKIICLDDGSAVAVGYVKSSKTGADLLVMQFDKSGSVSKQRIFQERGNQYGKDVIVTSSGFLILCTTDVKGTGQAEDISNVEGKKDVLLVQVDNDFNKTGSLQRGFPGNDEPVAMKKSLRGGYIVVGTTDRSPEAGQAGSNIFVLPVNNFLIPTEFRILGGTSDEVAADIEVLASGYLIAGTTGTESAQKGHIWKLPEDIYSQNIIAHTIELENASSFSINSICRYKNNSLLMAGKEGSTSSGDMLVFATDIDGNYIQGKVKIVGGTGLQVANDVIADGDDIVTVGSSAYEKNSMISLYKFRF